MSWNSKRFYVEYESDIFNPNRYNSESDSYGSYFHSYPLGATTLKTAQGYIRKIRKERTEENPRNFRIFDRLEEDEEGFALCVYFEL